MFYRCSSAEADDVKKKEYLTKVALLKRRYESLNRFAASKTRGHGLKSRSTAEAAPTIASTLHHRPDKEESRQLILRLKGAPATPATTSVPSSASTLASIAKSQKKSYSSSWDHRGSSSTASHHQILSPPF